MNLIKVFLVSLFLVSSATLFASHTPDTPECKEWKQQLNEIDQSITNSKEDLETCQSASDCHEIEILIGSLENEKSAIKKFIVNFCHCDNSQIMFA